MAIKTKFFIRVSNNKIETKSKDEVSIRIRVSNGRKFDLTALSNLQIKPEFWNNEKGIIRQRAEFKDEERKDLEQKLSELETHIKKEICDTPDTSKINSEWLNVCIDKYHNPAKYRQDNKTLFGYIQHFIDNAHTRTNPDTGNLVCYKMVREYNRTFNLLNEYAGKYSQPDFNDIDMEFYQQFVDFLRKKQLATNTIGKKIQTLKIFLNSATTDGINKKLIYKKDGFKAIEEETDNIYLTKDELKKLYDHDFSKIPHLERVRDVFIIACWTGLRYSDLQQLTPDKIKEDIFSITQMKTGKKAYIPIHPQVREIVNKYNGKLPKPISNQKYNDYLKTVAKDVELNTLFEKQVYENGFKVNKKFSKHELISSHTARRTFCTNAYDDNIPTLSIMAISGHKTEKAFLKYIKIDGEKHAKKVLEIWQNKGDFMRVAK